MDQRTNEALRKIFFLLLMIFLAGVAVLLVLLGIELQDDGHILWGLPIVIALVVILGMIIAVDVWWEL